MPGVEAIIQRYRPVPGGYLMAVRLAATVEITDWYAEFVMPEGVQVQAGRGTLLEQRPLSYKATPADGGHLQPSPGGVAAGAVYIAVGADQRAPLRLRVKAGGVNTGGYAAVTGVYVTGQGGRLVKSTEEWWPGSTSIKTSAEGWEYDSGGGFGGGGGGAAAARSSCSPRSTRRENCAGSSTRPTPVVAGAPVVAAAGAPPVRRTPPRASSRGRPSSSSPISPAIHSPSSRARSMPWSTV